MNKNHRKYIRSIVTDLPIKRGGQLEPSEIKTQRQLRRYVVIECSNMLVEKLENLIIYGKDNQIGK